MIYLLCTFIVLYIVLVGLFIYGWQKLRSVPVPSVIPDIFVSIIIPVRNETATLPLLLHDLSTQHYPQKKFEVIIVDDHSDDDTLALAEREKKQITNCKVFSLAETMHGKKQALQLGIRQAGAELIITLDADVRIGKYWLQNIVAFYVQEQASLIIAPVIMEPGNSFFDHFQALEFLSLVGSAASAASLSRPLMCNGANLAFRKELYHTHNAMHQYASGDDMFLLLESKKDKTHTIGFLKSTEAVATIKGTKNIHDFFMQRIRWISKSKEYRDRDVIVVAMIVFCSHLLLLLSLFSVLCTPTLRPFFICAFFAKSVIDYIFLRNLCGYFNIKKTFRYFPVIELVYIFYVPITAIAGQLIPFRWKGRKYFLTSDI